MINLALAVCSSVLVATVMRISKKYTSADRDVSMLAMNYIVCLLLGIMYNGFNTTAFGLPGFRTCLLFGVINGFLYLMGFVLLQINVEKNGVVMSSTFMRLGVLVPTILSITLFGEKPELKQVLGFLIALAAIILISTDKSNAGEQQVQKMNFKLGLILALLAGGTADAMSKVFEVYGNKELTNMFLITTFFFAFVFCVILLLMKKQSFGKMEMLFGILIAIPNYYSARFLLKAIMEIPAFVVYPTYSVSTIIVTGIVGAVLFRERIGKRQGISLLIILVALVLLNI